MSPKRRAWGWCYPLLLSLIVFCHYELVAWISSHLFDIKSIMLIQNLNPAVRYPSPVHHSLFFHCPCRTPHDYFRASTWTICRSLVPSPKSHSREEAGVLEVEGDVEVVAVLNHKSVQYDPTVASNMIRRCSHLHLLDVPLKASSPSSWSIV